MRLIMICLAFLCLHGCITINEEMLRKVDVKPPQNKISLVEIKTAELIQKHNGEGRNSGPLSGTTVLNSVARSIMIRWKDNGIIDDYGFPGDLSKEPDYTVTFSGTRNEESSIPMAVLSGLTMMILPSSATLIYDLDIELVNNATHKGYAVKAKNGSTLWMEILLLPALPFSLMGGMNAMRDIADYSYVEFDKQGAFGPP
jgi:hypothetical protein